MCGVSALSIVYSNCHVPFLISLIFALILALPSEYYGSLKPVCVSVC